MEKILEKLKKPGTVVCRLPNNSEQWGLFTNPVKILQGSSEESIFHITGKIENLLEKGYYIAGYWSYESASSFDSAIANFAEKKLPGVWLAVYDSEPDIFNTEKTNEQNGAEEFYPEISKKEYLKSLGKIKEYIKSGDTYQTNFTYRSSGEKISSEMTFIQLFQNHYTPYSAFLNCGDFKVVSASPELFIEKKGNFIRSKPMKGTAARKPLYEDDIQEKKALAADEKNCAENIMILDMARNDFGKICKYKTVRSSGIFNVETYRTIHQMTSSVQGELREGICWTDIFKALFPAASITGTPKIRATEIIKELEKSPRGIYTGTIGCFTPENNACLNVAIRTLTSFSSKTELGVGGGIVADSIPESEWYESILKSKFQTESRKPFKILETILWTENMEFCYLEEHICRLRKSAEYFNFNFNEKKLIEKLHTLSNKISAKFAKIRILLSQNGQTETEFTKLKIRGWGKNHLKIQISDKNTNSSDPFLYHKSTNRNLYNSEYEAAKAAGFDEVIFFNEKNELTEGAISNIFIKINEKWFTPEIHCGLLPGIWRKIMINKLNAEEVIIKKENFLSSEKILIGNSVKGSCSASMK